MNAVLAWLGTYALHSTALLLAVALLTLVVRRDSWRDVLWKAGLAGGLVTATLQLALDVRPLVGRWTVGQPTATTREQATVPDSPGLASGDSRATAVRYTAPEATTRPVNSGRSAIAIPWSLVVVSAWGAIALLLLLRLGALYLRLHRVLRDRRAVTDPRALALLAELRRHAGVWGHVRLSMTARCATPLALGASEICVPEALLRLPTDELRGALAHELAHLARRDPLWQLGTGLVAALCFFQPLNRLARRRLRDCAEHLSDDWAVHHTGSAVSLARCLAAVASWVSPAEPLPDATIAMAEGGSPLLRRVERLLEGRAAGAAPRAWLRVTTGVALVGAVLAAAPSVTSRSAPGPAAPVDWSGQGKTEVIQLGNEIGSLRQRFRTAVAQAKARGLRDYWIAYAFEGTVGPFRTDSDSAGDRAGSGTLGDVMYQGQWDPQSTRGDIVPLFRMRADGRATATLVRVAGRSYEQPAMADVLPIYCLDAVSETESLTLLDSLMAEQRLGPIRTALLSIIATHGSRRRGGFGAVRQDRGDAALATLFDVAMHDRVPDIQQSAAEALGKFAPDRSAPLLRRIVWEHGSSDVRRQATEAIGGLPADIALPLLDSIADHHEDVAVVRQAVEEIGGFPSDVALPRLLRVLRNHPARAARGEALDAIENLDGRRLPDPDPNLDPGVDPDPNPDADSESDDAPDAERVALGPGDYAAARANARRYESGQDGAAVHRLARELDHEPQHAADLVRDRAAWALARMADQKLVQPLIAALDAADWRIRAFAAWNLGVAADARATPAVRNALRDPHWRVRVHAAYAAGALRDRGAVTGLLKLLDDSHWPVRAAAAENLGDIGDRSALRQLKAAERDDHAAVRDAAATALRQLR